MRTDDDDDDTSPGAITQGGSRDSGAAGPARSSGRSFVWVAAAVLIMICVAVAVITLPHKRAPAEENTTTVSSTLADGLPRPTFAPSTPTPR